MEKELSLIKETAGFLAYCCEYYWSMIFKPGVKLKTERELLIEYYEENYK